MWITLRGGQRGDRRVAGPGRGTGFKQGIGAELAAPGRARVYARSWESRWPQVQKYDKPLSEATTSSLEALKAFSPGRYEATRHSMELRCPAALPARDGTGFPISPWPMPAWVRCTTTWDRVSWPEANRQKGIRAARPGQRAREAVHHVALLRDSGQLDKGITALELLQADVSAGFHSLQTTSRWFTSRWDSSRMRWRMAQGVQIDPDSASGYSERGFAYSGLTGSTRPKATLQPKALQHKAGAAVTLLHWPLSPGCRATKRAPSENSPRSRNDPQGDFQVTGLRSGWAAYAGQLKAGTRLRTKAGEKAAGRSWIQGSGQRANIPRSIHRGRPFLSKARALEDVSQALKLSRHPM